MTSPRPLTKADWEELGRDLITAHIERSVSRILLTGELFRQKHVAAVAWVKEELRKSNPVGNSITPLHAIRLVEEAFGGLDNG